MVCQRCAQRQHTTHQQIFNQSTNQKTSSETSQNHSRLENKYVLQDTLYKHSCTTHQDFWSDSWFASDILLFYFVIIDFIVHDLSMPCCFGPCLFWSFITGSSCKTADFSLVTYTRLLQSFSSLKHHPFLQSTVCSHSHLPPSNQQPMVQTNIFDFSFLHHNTEVTICHGFILILNNFKYTELNYSKVEGDSQIPGQAPAPLWWKGCMAAFPDNISWMCCHWKCSKQH